MSGVKRMQDALSKSGVKPRPASALVEHMACIRYPWVGPAATVGTQ